MFEKSLANVKKHELDMTGKVYDDIVELLCYLDPRVPYTMTGKALGVGFSEPCVLKMSCFPTVTLTDLYW